MVSDGEDRARLLSWRLRRREEGNWRCLCRCFKLQVLGTSGTISLDSGDFFSGDAGVDWMKLTRIRKSQAHSQSEARTIDHVQARLAGPIMKTGLEISSPLSLINTFNNVAPLHLIVIRTIITISRLFV
jgi:hypothetical protein